MWQQWKERETLTAVSFSNCTSNDSHQRRSGNQNTYWSTKTQKVGGIFLERWGECVGGRGRGSEAVPATHCCWCESIYFLHGLAKKKSYQIYHTAQLLLRSVLHDEREASLSPIPFSLCVFIFLYCLFERLGEPWHPHFIVLRLIPQEVSCCCSVRKSLKKKHQGGYFALPYFVIIMKQGMEKRGSEIYGVWDYLPSHPPGLSQQELIKSLMGSGISLAVIGHNAQ